MANTAVSDNVQNLSGTYNDNVHNRSEIAAPLFFIGSSPSQASTIINPSYPAAGVMISVNALRDRKSDFQVGDWILDSGAFTEVARHGGYRHGVEQYYWQIKRWSQCGNLLTAVAQDWMCESFVLERTGLTITDHQRLTIERYDQLMRLAPSVPIMPVLQGYRVSDYLKHLADYENRLTPNAWIGVGSVCKRNGSPEIADLLRAVKLIRPDLRLHGFGLKNLALQNEEVRNLLYSCDSMAWSYPKRFQTAVSDNVQNHWQPLAHKYQQSVQERIDGTYNKTIPSTAGAGNGQGRKPKWSGATVARRFPKIFKNGKAIEDLEEIARQWDE